MCSMAVKEKWEAILFIAVTVHFFVLVCFFQSIFLFYFNIKFSQNREINSSRKFHVTSNS